MLRALVFVAPVVLAVYALVDLVQTDRDRVQGLPKPAWGAVILLLAVLGPLGWLLGGKRGRTVMSLLTRLPGLGDPRQPRGGRGPMAPDDDPDFLRGLGRRPPRPVTPPPSATDDTDPDDDPPLASR